MSRQVNFPQRVEFLKIPNNSLFIFYFKKKISTIVLMDHAKMADVAEMPWMILTAAVLLGTLGTIVVLVSMRT